MSISYSLVSRQAIGDWKTGRVYKRKYLALTTANEDEEAVLIGTGLNYGDPHPSNPNARLSNITADDTNIEGAKNQYFVNVEWKTDFGSLGQDGTSTSENPGNRPENPLLRAAEWTFTFTKHSHTYTIDLNGKPYLNAAGQPFESGVDDEDGFLTITVKKNKSPGDLSATWFEDRFQAVNNAAWLGFGQYELLIADVHTEGPAQFENDIPFYQVVYTILRNKHFKWHPFKVLNAGYYEIDPTKAYDDPARLKQILDKWANPVTSPYPLKLDGTKGDPDNPTYIEFQKYSLKNFTTLGIP